MGVEHLRQAIKVWKEDGPPLTNNANLLVISQVEPMANLGACQANVRGASAKFDGEPRGDYKLGHLESSLVVPRVRRALDP